MNILKISSFKPMVALALLFGVVVFNWGNTVEGLSIEAYQTALLFLSTIAVIMLNILPAGAVAIISLSIYAALNVGGAATSAAAISDALSGFSSSLIWLIVVAVIISKAFRVTGLGERISLLLLSTRFGKSTLGVAYILTLADWIIAPVTPSNTARASIISPIAASLASAINPSDKKLGRYFISSISAANDISASAFTTAFLGNLVAVGLIFTATGINLDFTTWTMYMLAPALVVTLVMPIILFYFISPETKYSDQACQFAKDALSKIGSIKKSEIWLIATLCTLLILWVFGKQLGINSTTAAFIGLSILLASKVLSWDDVISEKSALDLLIWFGFLLSIANKLTALGFSKYLGGKLSVLIDSFAGDVNGYIVLFVVTLLYLATSYFFASSTAKIIAIVPVLIASLMASTTIEPIFICMMLVAASNYGGNLCGHSHARNPMLMQYGYHSVKDWMSIGLVISLSATIIFFFVAIPYWSFL